MNRSGFIKTTMAISCASFDGNLYNSYLNKRLELNP